MLPSKMSLHVFLLYFLTWTLVALTPGPAVMCSMAQATRHGFNDSYRGFRFPLILRMSRRPRHRVVPSFACEVMAGTSSWRGACLFRVPAAILA